MIMKTMIALIASLMITGCANHKSYLKTVNQIPDVLQIGQSLLSRDTIEEVDYPILTREQCESLHRLTTFEVPDSTRFIGIRPISKTLTLEAYKVPAGEDTNHFKVYFVTRDNKGGVIDALDLREFHTSEHQQPMRLGGNRFYTTDASITFDGEVGFTLHRVMTLTSLYLKDHSLTEAWRVEWDNHYEITNTGRILFKGQQETLRSPVIDDPVIDEYKSRDLQIRQALD